MKVYGIPKEVPFAEPDYRNYNRDVEERREIAHQEALKTWMVDQGCNGERTGEVVRFGVADGYAQYMFADRGRSSYLMLLPYGDAYQYQHVEFLPQAEIIKLLDQEKRMSEIFARR
jgi:hypothetical protein